MKKLEHILMLATCLLMMAAVAINRDHKLLGHDFAKHDQPTADTTATQRQLPDGTIVINTTSIASDIKGFGGSVPLEISIKGRRIADIQALSNSETPSFFSRASELFAKWKGKTLDEAMTVEVEAVTGATFSSNAIIGNMQAGLRYANENSLTADDVSSTANWTWQSAAALIVALMAALLPLFIRNKTYHTVQLVLNILVLGFWSGTFLSYSLIVGWLSSGINVAASLSLIVLAITAFVYPLFGKHQYYCTHVCPFGSLQQLVGRANKRKLKLGTATVERLTMFRRILWALLMLCLWSGVLFEWMDYEPFAAFIFGSASWIVIAIAVVFILLSAFVARPYCRFVCPTGTLLKLSENIEHIKKP